MAERRTVPAISARCIAGAPPGPKSAPARPGTGVESACEKRGADLSKRFEPGTPLKVTIIDVSADGKIRLSMTAQQAAEERRGFDEFRAKAGSSRGATTAMEDAFKRAMKSHH